MMRQLTWPEAFVLVFGALPAVVFAVAVLAAYPAVGWPLLGIGTAAVWTTRRQAKQIALAARAAVDYRRNAALVAAPLPDMPTDRIARPLHAVPTQPRRAVR